MTFGAFLKDRIWSVIALLALLALGGYVLTQFQFNPYAAALLGIAAITAV